MKLFKLAKGSPSGNLGQSLSSEGCSITSKSFINRTVERAKKFLLEYTEKRPADPKHFTSSTLLVPDWSPWILDEPCLSVALGKYNQSRSGEFPFGRSQVPKIVTRE